MKVLTFSKSFPKGHPKAGQQTHFVEQVWNCFRREDYSLPDSFSQWVKNFPFKSEAYLNAIKAISVHGVKHHTIRAGSRWKAGDMASLRIWSDKPYRSKQIEFAQVEIKKVLPVMICIKQTSPVIAIDNKLLTYGAGCELANNDGLTITDFISWFAMKHTSQISHFAGQIICWSDKINYTP